MSCGRLAAERNSEENFIANLHGFRADVVRVLDRANKSAAVEGDVELAGNRKTNGRDNDLRKFLNERLHVNQFVRVNSSGGFAVRLRMLSAPAPRVCRPTLWIRRKTSGASSAESNASENLRAW